MKNKGLRPRGRFRIGRAESYGREAGGIHNEPERVSYRRAVSAMEFVIGAILQVIISEYIRSWLDPVTGRSKH